MKKTTSNVPTVSGEMSTTSITRVSTFESRTRWTRSKPFRPVARSHM